MKRRDFLTSVAALPALSVVTSSRAAASTRAAAQAQPAAQPLARNGLHLGTVTYNIS